MRSHNSLPARVKQRDLVCGAQVQGVHPRGRATTHTTHPRRPRHGDTSVSTNSIFSLNLFFSNSKNYFCSNLHWIMKNPKLKFAKFSNLKFGIFKLQNWNLPTFQTWSLEFSNSTKFENSQTSSLFGRFPNKLPKFGHSANKLKLEVWVWELPKLQVCKLEVCKLEVCSQTQTQTQTSWSLPISAFESILFVD